MKIPLTSLEQCIRISNTLTDKELMQLLNNISLRIHKKNKEVGLEKNKSNN